MLVQHTDGNRYVMKTVDIGNLDIEQQKDSVNEVKVLSSLKHPYIVRYHESFINEGTLAIVMDYAEGGDLAKRIGQTRSRRETFDEPQVLRWLTQIALGLKHLHQRQIIHRDMKPQNIFLTKNDDLRIGDFGISKRLGNKKAVVEQTMGTPYYLSPEICTERLYSFASDTWALGCIVFELAALHVPFEAQNISSLIKKITSGAVPTLPQAYSNELRQIASSLLCPDHKKRPTASEIVQGALVQAEMRKMLGGFPGSTPTPSPPLSSLPSPAPSPPVSALPTFRGQSPRGAACAARPQSALARMASPRSRLRDSGNNLMLTPGRKPKEMPEAPLLRAVSACGNRKAFEDPFLRKPPNLRPTTASRPPCARPHSAVRPQSAARVEGRQSYAFAGG